MAATRPVVMSQPMSNTLCLPQFSAPAASPVPAPLQAPAPPAAQSTSSGEYSIEVLFCIFPLINQSYELRLILFAHSLC